MNNLDSESIETMLKKAKKRAKKRDKLKRVERIVKRYMGDYQIDLTEGEFFAQLEMMRDDALRFKRLIKHLKNEGVKIL